MNKVQVFEYFNAGSNSNEVHIQEQRNTLQHERVSNWHICESNKLNSCSGLNLNPKKQKKERNAFEHFFFNPYIFALSVCLLEIYICDRNLHAACIFSSLFVYRGCF